MNKKILTLIIGVLIIVLCAAALISCEKNDDDVLQYSDAKITDHKIEVEVAKDVKSVNLKEKITVKNGYTWKLYADKMGLVELPTKVAQNILTEELLDGDNEFCIIVNSEDGKKTIVYELTIFRNHDVCVNYEYNGRIVKSDTVETYSTYNVSIKGNEDFFDEGFVFNGWKDEDGNKVTSTLNIKKEGVVLTADLTGKSTTVTLDANGGDLSSNTATVTYGQVPTLPTPTKVGYRFVGWYVNENPFTTYNANYSTELTAIANWQKQSYRVYITQSDPSIYATNTVNQYYDGTTEYYGNSVTVSTSVYSGHNYTWLGWYEDDKLVSTELTFEFTMPDHEVHLVVRWEEYVARQYIQVSDEEPIEQQYPRTLKAGTTINLSAPTELTGLEDVTKIWLGWFANDELISYDFNYEYVMPYNSVNIVGKFKLLTYDKPDTIKAYVINAQMQTTTTVKPGENVTLLAKPYVGYCFNGWYVDSVLLSTDRYMEFNIPNEDACIGLQCELLDDMENLVFTSDETECLVTDIKDKSVTDLVIPSCVTEIKEGLLVGCNNLVNLTIPFAGQRAYAQLSISYTDSTDLRYYFGHFFGSKPFDNGIKVAHTLRNDKTTASVYIPSTLQSVTVLGGNIRHGGFSNCKMLKTVTICDDVESIGINGFYGCYGLTDAIFESQNWKLFDGDRGYRTFSMTNTQTNANYLAGIYSDYVWLHQ